MANARQSTLLIYRQQDKVQQVQDQLFEVAIKYVGKGHVIFFTLERFERFTESALAQFSDMFKNIIFYYVQSIDKLMEKLVDLQRWENCIPAMIIVDSLDSMTITGDCQSSEHALVMAYLADTAKILSAKLKSVCKCIAAVSDVAYNDFPVELYVKECYVLNAEKLSGFSDIMHVLAEMTYQQ
ncbi:AGAP009078-PA-like protein [Anopheles sinensis]|uniref:AGAP009078-PA-like protein n=1 Tax=Anopheles sinensis TaxID=74873 RepID=A0A084VNV9_ANOSI|nr:AGAP009078-PA-like protein [Anopheles sinensis]